LVERRAAVTHWGAELQSGSPILRYGFSFVCVGLAIGPALLAQHYGFRDVGLPLFTLAIAIVTWYAGLGPSGLAVVLATVLFDYFFVEPLYSLAIAPQDIPYFIIFVAWAVVVASFAEVRRRIEDNLRRSREELAARAAELEATNKELESFTYSVSHDLRAPLRHVAGFSELLHKHAASSLDDRSRRYIRSIMDSAKKMGTLIDDLLGFSRIGRAETMKAAVNLEQLAREAVAEVGRDASGRNIAWKIGALPVTHGDRAMLRLVMVNLVSNAVKFTRNRSAAEIEIGSAREDAREVEIFVRDNGAGFDMQHVNKLFGVFQRLHLAEEFEGTGIGLATVQRIVHRHGGKVRAEGAVDKGATFYFSLPKG
jgi:light-regulated signal transduction histidine kinase (bacteriophytochrome)